ncbi:MAG: hypothetical protein R2828_08255 [Saprospiraceae bacterium]
MKQPYSYTRRVEALLVTKNWEALSPKERENVLAEMDQETYEKYRCLILVSKEMHQYTPALSPGIKDHLLQQMRLKKASSSPKNGIKWFQWQVPVWQVSLASLAFILLYMSGVPQNLSDTSPATSAPAFFLDHIDTVFLDKGQTPEDSSNQDLPFLESSLQKFNQPMNSPQDLSLAISYTDRSQLVMGWPQDDDVALLPPTQALLNAENTIPLELMEIQG